MSEQQPQDYEAKAREAANSALALNDLANAAGVQERRGTDGVTESDNGDASLVAFIGQTPAAENKKVTAIVEVSPSRAAKPGGAGQSYSVTAHNYGGSVYVHGVKARHYHEGEADKVREYKGDQADRLGAAILRRTVREVGPKVKEAADNRVADIQAAKKSLDTVEQAARKSQ